MRSNLVLKELVDSGIKALGIDLTERGINMLCTYLNEIQRWNRRYNLVHADKKELVLNHLLDSLSAFRIFMEHIKRKFNKSNVEMVRSADLQALQKMDFRIADIGSGAGFPGIPLAVALNEAEILRDKKFSVNLVERSANRASFLKNICLLLKLNNVQVINEDLRRMSRGNEKFDIVTARAFSDRGIRNIVVLIENIIKIVKTDGFIVLYKGKIEKIIGEIVMLNKLFSNIEVVELKVPFLDAERHVLILRKLNYMGVA